MASLPSALNLRQALYDWYCPLLQRLGPAGARVLELEGYLKLDGGRHPAERLGDSVSLYVSADLSEAPRPRRLVLHQAYLQADCQRLPFRDACFDLVHVTFPSRADSFSHQGRLVYTTFGLSHMAGSAQGVARVLKPDGCFVVFPFWTGDELWEDTLRRTFGQHGFHLTVEGPFQGLFVAIFHRLPAPPPAEARVSTGTDYRVVSLRLDDSTYARLVRKAAQKGLSAGEWLTRLVDRESREGWWWRRFRR